MIREILIQLKLISPILTPRKEMLISDIQMVLFFAIFLIILGYIVSRIKNKSPSKNIIVLLFIVIFYLPLIQEWTHAFQLLPVIENRIRASRPKQSFFSGMETVKWDYPKKYEAYFNDNFGFRDILIRFKNQIEYSLFKTSDEVLIGTDNWLFYKREEEHDEIILEKLDEKYFSDIENKILMLNTALNRKDILLVILPIPEKNSIYPEFNTRSTIKRPSETRFRKFINSIKAHSEMTIVDVPEILLKNKKTQTLFHRTDFHWNDIGAYYISQELVDILAKKVNKNVEWKYPFSVKYEPNCFGGQNNSLAILLPYCESQPSTDSQKQYATNSLPMPQYLDSHFKSSFVESQPLLPQTVLLGNSFSLNFIHTGLFDHFTELYYLRNYNLKNIEAFIPEGTEIVIWQFIEVNLTDKNLL